MKTDDFPDELAAILRSLGVLPTQAVISLNGYPAINRGRRLLYVHRLVAAEIKGETLTRKIFVHHIDGDRTNFRPANLEAMTHGEHNGEHRRFGATNHFFGRKHSAETKAILSAKPHPPVIFTDEAKAKISAALRQRWKRPDYAAKIAAAVSAAKRGPEHRFKCARCGVEKVLPYARRAQRFCSNACNCAMMRANRHKQTELPHPALT